MGSLLQVFDARRETTPAVYLPVSTSRSGITIVRAWVMSPCWVGERPPTKSLACMIQHRAPRPVGSVHVARPSPVRSIAPWKAQGPPRRRVRYGAAHRGVSDLASGGGVQSMPARPPLLPGPGRAPRVPPPGSDGPGKPGPAPVWPYPTRAVPPQHAGLAKRVPAPSSVSPRA